VGRENWDPGGGVQTGYETLKKTLLSNEYDTAHFVLHFIPGSRQIISQIVCNESHKIPAIVVVCGGGYNS
jgi:hypothetical protein